MQSDLEDTILTPDLETMVADYKADPDLDPLEQQRDQNAHLLLTAWKVVMEARLQREPGGR